jgi:peptidoglycan/xylan/chitin deacetylase (PgdA/CDA1 family)
VKTKAIPPRRASIVVGLAVSLVGAAAAAAAAPCPPDVLGVARTLALSAKGGFQIGLKTYPRTLALEDHEVVLTFDDGPGGRTTGKVLDALRDQCVKATFFLIGRNAQALPALVRREIAEGHTVGHHTFSHPAATLRRMGETVAQEDINKGFAADDLAAYNVAGTEPRTPFFRFPGFADTPALDAWLSSRDIAVFGADLWASDWLPMSAETELALVLSRLEREKRGILLMHDIKAQTAAMLPDLLRELKQRGFKIVHIVPGDDAPPLRAAPAGWTSETEKIIAGVFARDGGGPSNLQGKAPAKRSLPEKGSNAGPAAETETTR